MNQSIIITSHVLNTINSLPAEERVAIASAVAGEMILGQRLDDSDLTPLQSMIYQMIRDYIRRDSYKLAQ